MPEHRRDQARCGQGYRHAKIRCHTADPKQADRTHCRRTQSPLKRPITIASEKPLKPVAAPSIPAPAHSRKKTAVQSPTAPSAIRARNASAPKADQGARRPRQHTDPIGAGDLTAQQGSRGGEQHRSNNDGPTQRLDGSRDTAPDGERRYARRGQTTGAVETV